MSSATEDRDALQGYLTKSQKEAFQRHNKIMRDLEESGFKPKPEKKVFSQTGQEISGSPCLQSRSEYPF
ncbi:MAG: hypothetical protein IJU76_12745 [Desulfovibrionaceae bacterium]|nr:hypothetical protein [Desulfovibrionaceae bacterium]